MLKHRLSDGYVRVDGNPGEEQLNDIALDISDQSAWGTLLGLAEGVSLLAFIIVRKRKSNKSSEL